MKYLLYILAMLSVTNLFAFEECDSIRTCTHNAMTFAVSSGKGAHYLEVQDTESLESIADSMTVDFWLKAEEQAGKTQYIAGIWGPGEDYNDVWAIYIDKNNQLSFMLNGENSNKGYLDNTICTADYSSYFDSWHHIYAIFDGNSSEIALYIDGVKVSSSINTEYPIKKLRQRANTELNLQIGSTNALSDNLSDNRTLLGQIDEFRLWDKIFDEDKMFCQKDESLDGNEEGLILYHRYNETPDNYIICDATGNGNFGMARSGAACTPSKRYYKNTLVVTSLDQELPLKDTIVCDYQRIYNFKVENISSCPKEVIIRLRGDYSKNYTIAPTNRFTLNQFEEQDFSLSLEADFVGEANSILDVYSNNRCRDWNSFKMEITRLTEFSYSTDSIGFDILKSNCKEVREYTKSVKICNNSNAVGTGRVLEIQDILTTNSNVFEILLPQPLPIQLNPGECIDIPIRFNNIDIAGDYYDSLQVVTNDKCDTTRFIELEGHIIEVFRITDESGNNEITSFDFGTECIDYITPAQSYIWQNMTKDNDFIEEESIIIDTIIVPTHFISKTFSFPLDIDQYDGNYIQYFRFLPTAQGTFKDSVTFVIKAGECTIEKKIEVNGKGYYAELAFQDTLVNFGTVIIGQEKQIDIPITNLSDEPVNLLTYLRYGTGFFFASGQDLNLAPNQTKNISIIFRPIADSSYTDQLCYLEKRCYESDCIPLLGKGQYENFSYNPNILTFNNILACDGKIDSISFKNTSNKSYVLNSFVLDDPSNKFAFLDNSTLQTTSPPSSLNIAVGEEVTFVFSYFPNDLTKDRGDRAFFRFKDDTGVDWHLKLYGTSVNPKIFITENTKYGIIEVNDTKRDTLTIENISEANINLDSLYVSDGFIIVYPNPAGFNKTLAPQDTIMVIVDFVPTEAKRYTGKISVEATSPCISSFSGMLSGTAIIVPLEVPISTISYGYIKSCDCEERTITLINSSNSFPMIIDSVWIDDFNTANPYPEFFSWTSTYYEQNGSQLPFEIPANSFDTLVVTYCPGNPSTRDFINNDATLHLTSHGQAWNRDFTVYLAGKRNLTFEATPTYVAFPPTRVDTLAPSRYIDIIIPEIAVNPSQKSIKIDSISFEPNERVFSAIDTITGRSTNLSLDTNQVLTLRVDFKPRAVREYFAKMILHFSEPCTDIDSTIELYGSSFAPAYALNLRFDSTDVVLDTFRMKTCDTLYVPIYVSREIPAEIADVKMKMIYDTTLLDLVGGDSYYLSQNCFNYTPQILFTDTLNDGKAITLKNFCSVDSIRPLYYAKFVSKLQQRDTLRLKIDSISFDTEEVLLYDIIATNDSADVIILEPDFEVTTVINYDSVQILDCVSRTLSIRNTGDIPLSIANILNLPSDIEILSSIPPLETLFNVGDSALVELLYCPKSKDTIDRTIYPFSNNPCDVSDSSRLYGLGFAPDLPLVFRFDLIKTIPHFNAKLGERISIPVFLDTNLVTTLDNIDYWLQDLNFTLTLSYNPRALQYIDYTNATINISDVDYKPGKINFYAENVDSLKRGKIFDIIFEATVPDSVTSSLNVSVNQILSNELMFLDLYPSGGEAIYTSEGKCSITYFKYQSEETMLFSNYPNPWNNKTTVKFLLGEKVPVTLELYSYAGDKVETLIEGKTIFERGEYSVDIYSDKLQAGMYIIYFKAGIYTKTMPIMLVE